MRSEFSLSNNKRSDFSLNKHTVDPMLPPSGNPFKCHEEVLSLQSIIPPKRFDIFPLTGGCSEGLDAFRVFFKHTLIAHVLTLSATCSTEVRT